MIAILVAMEEECLEILKHIKILKTEFFAKRKFYFFKLNNKEYVLALTGIGLVNASITTSIVCLKYNVKYIINFGSAGSINSKIQILDLILVDKALYFDFNLTFFGKEFGQIPNEKLFFKPKKKIYEKFVKILKFNNVNYKIGTIFSGSTFINKKSISKYEIFKKIQSDCVDMETAAIIHTSNKLNVSSIIFKYISDSIFLKDSEKVFKENLARISINIWNLLKIIG